MLYGDNGRPLGRRRTVQILALLTLLAWATHTLLAQWALGAQPETAPAVAGQERFVPATSASGGGGTLELRGEATVIGASVQLRQICRWAESDNALFAPIADLDVARLDERPSVALNVDQLKTRLQEAGVNLAVIRFAGATACAVTRSDSPPMASISGDALTDAARTAAGQGSGSPIALSVAPASAGAPDGKQPTDPAAATSKPAPQAAEHYHTLRDVLVKDLSDRTHVPVDSLQVDFAQRDQKLLNLSEPFFHFDLVPQQFRTLGNVRWDLVILTQNGSQKATIDAVARAWQDQVVLTRPVDQRQVIRHDDVAERRILVDRLEDDPLLTLKQVVGQQAVLTLKAGTVMTARLVDAVPLVRTGQLVTITVEKGRVSVTTVARALEGGSYGQTIRVKNEATQDVYEVVLTAPQTAQMGPLMDSPTHVALAGG